MLNKLTEKKIVPVTVIEDADHAVPLAEALLEAGLDVIEITFRTGAAAESVKRISESVPGMLVGAGTLLSTYQVDKAIDAGAKYGVTPGTNPEIVEHAHSRSLPLSPGVVTPSEVERAHAMGCAVLKFFPAEAAGGVSYLKALAGPYAHTGVKFIPTGGINSSNMRDYLSLTKVVAAIGGSWMVDKELIANQKWDEIKKLTREALEIAGEYR